MKHQPFNNKRTIPLSANIYIFCYWLCLSRGNIKWVAVDEEIPPVHHGGVLSDRNQ